MQMNIRPFVTLLKLVVVPIGLIWLATSFLTDQLSAITNPNWWLLATALVLNQLALTMFALRMRLALRSFGINVSLYQAQRIHLQSMFYFFVLPMTVGLEAARFGKIRYLLNTQSSWIGLASSLVVDRLIGALAAVLLAIAIWPMIDFQIPLRWHQEGFLPWVIVGLAVAIAIPIGRKVAQSLPRFTTGERPDIKRLNAAMVVALITHLMFATGVCIAVLGANLKADFAQTIFVVSASMIFGILPVSFAGAGPVEGAGVAALIAMGIPLEEALVFIMIAYVAKLVAALQGGVWEFIDGTREYIRRESAPDR
jgi:uncharacterized membrane protein YbhN (UPF0104 family)